MDRPTDTGARRAPGRSRLLALVFMPLLALALLSGMSGCQIVIGVLMMLKGFPTQDSDFKQFTKKSLDEKGKKVVILSSSTGSALAAHPALDLDIIAEVSRVLRSQNINVVDAHDVARFLDDNGEITNATDLAEIGPQFDADYIILFKFEDFGYREPNSPGLYRGHARGKVVVVELSDDGPEGRVMAKPIYKKPFDSKYPINSPAQAEHEKPSVFAQRYIARLAEELARYFYDHRPGEDM